ncbi:MAG: glycosyltransferase family 2 protein [Nitrososphaerales archaeon]
MKTVACIPAYLEERSIAKVVIGSKKYVDSVIVCDDGSSDMTATIAEMLGAKVVRHKVNVGKGEALRSLFIASRELDVDVMITIDGDGQHDPDEIPRLLEPIVNGTADIVVGSRFLGDKNAIPSHRKIGNKLLNSLTVSGISDTQCGFRAYGREAIQSILPSEMGMGADSEILMEASRQHLRIVEVPVSVKYGIGGTSKRNAAYHIIDVFASIIKIITIKRPLLTFGGAGIILIIIGSYFAERAFQLLTATETVTNLLLTYGLIAFALFLTGFLTLFTGIILFSMSSLMRRETSD